MGRREAAWALIAGFLVVTVIAAIAGSRALPREITDPRRSTHLWGPNGMSGLAESLERLGVPVVVWERPLSRLPIDDARQGAWLGLMDVGGGVTDLDVARVIDWLENGGGALIGGDSPIAECVGYRLAFGRRTEMEDERIPPSPLSWEPIPSDDDSAPERVSTRELMRRCEVSTGRPDSVFALANVDGAPVVLSLWLRGGGRLLLLAEVAHLANEALRETGAGEVILPLFLAQQPGRLIVDEYHHGFGARASLFGATWAWLVRTPAGWAMLHLAFAGLVWVGVTAVRFGPALNVIERRRRSPLEHVDALATGLERAKATETAIGLVAGGLRRRLGRLGSRGPRGEAQQAWIDALALSARSDDARAAVRRLAQTLDGGRSPEGVLTAALAVEDVWEALRPDQSSRTS